MQRQSLGGSPSSLSLSPSLNQDIDLDEAKKSAKSPSKPHRFSIHFPSSSLSPPSPSSPTLPPQHKFIHAIPLLTLFCFLVLFLFSHDPSPSDLAQFKGFKGPTTTVTDPGDLIHGDGYRGIGGRGSGDEAVWSWRNLQESNKSRVNRKFANF